MSEGNCVKVISGPHKGETGIIVMLENEQVVVAIGGGMPEWLSPDAIEVVECIEE